MGTNWQQKPRTIEMAQLITMVSVNLMTKVRSLEPTRWESAPTSCPLDFHRHAHTNTENIFKKKNMFEFRQYFSHLSLLKHILTDANKFFTGDTCKKRLSFPRKHEQTHQVWMTCLEPMAVPPQSISALRLFWAGLLSVLAFTCILSLIFPRNVSREGKGSLLHLPCCSHVPHFCVL